MDARNLDPRDAPALELQPAVPPPAPTSNNTLTIDPELPTTIEQLRNIVRAEVLKILSQVPRGEA